MTTNIMQQYIKNKKSFLKNFSMLFLKQKYNEKISNELINAYIEARIYNFGDAEYTFFYKRIQSNIDKKKDELIEKIKEKDKESLELNVELYQFIFYIDGVRQINDIDEFVKNMCERRTEDFNIKPERSIEKKFLKQINDFKEQKNKFIDKLYTEDFELIVEKYINIDNTYKANLNFNFKLPYIYSDQIIEEVYNEGTINEDKLIIAYILLTAECIKDIEDGNFAKTYIVNFARTLLEKDKKIKQTLRIINDQAIQEKIVLKVSYEDFENYKDEIYELMQEGYRFAVVIDNTFDAFDTNLRKLNSFYYMLVSPNCRSYEKIRSKEEKIKNTIIYDV